MDTNMLLARGETYIFNEVDGEMVMMNTNTGMYVSLNDTAKQIWNMLDEPKAVAKIIEVLAGQYNVTKEQCENDVMPFIEQLLERQIAVIA